MLRKSKASASLSIGQQNKIGRWRRTDRKKSLFHNWMCIHLPREMSIEQERRKQKISSFSFLYEIWISFGYWRNKKATFSRRLWRYRETVGGTLLLVFPHPVPPSCSFLIWMDRPLFTHLRSVPGEKEGHKWRSYAPKTQGRRQCRVPEEWEGVRAACRVSPSHFAKRTLGGWLCFHPWHMQPLLAHVLRGDLPLALYPSCYTTTWPSSFFSFFLSLLWWRIHNTW